jgi:hypothetical protein
MYSGAKVVTKGGKNEPVLFDELKEAQFEDNVSAKLPLLRIALTRCLEGRRGRIEYQVDK